MSLAPWRSPLARALHRNRALVYSRYVQLATVQPNGRPANRTVVFRGFLDETNYLQFITDTRSEKMHDLQHTPWSEVCWYFPKSREQFRIAGCVFLIQPDTPDPDWTKARHRLWQNLSDAARLQFAWAASGHLRDPADPFSPDAPDPLNPPSNFCLLLLAPSQVDHLELRGNPQNRYRYQQNEQQQWVLQEINP